MYHWSLLSSSPFLLIFLVWSFSVFVFVKDGRIPPFFEDVGALLSIQYHWLSEHAFSGCFLETIQLHGGGAHSAVPGPARLKGLPVLPTLMLIPSGQQTFLDRVISRVGISNLWLFLNTVTRSLLAAGPQAENRHTGVCFDSSCCRQTGFLSQRKQYTTGFRIWIPPSCYLFICSWLVTALPTLWIVTS